MGDVSLKRLPRMWELNNHEHSKVSSWLGDAFHLFPKCDKQDTKSLQKWQIVHSGR